MKARFPAVPAKQLPAIPLEVAEAIESFRIDGHDTDYIVEWLSKDLNKEGLISSNRIRILRNYAQTNGFNLVAALVIGYTIEDPEPTTEEKIEAAVREEYLKWAKEPPETSDSGFVVNGTESIKDLSKRITLRVREIISEERNKNPN